MSIVVGCSCGKQFSAEPRLAGQTVQCPSCSSPLTIPVPAAATLPPPQTVTQFTHPHADVYPEQPYSFTTDNSTRAGNPGRLPVMPLRYVSFYPTWPIVWATSFIINFDHEDWQELSVCLHYVLKPYRPGLHTIGWHA